ncbi:MAG: outer membrane beta-barrel protein [Deltaproteobacteria bacterium]|nr:outer membrane beta-barrel protein [Deltaproteobacteria bacterium]
MKRSIAATVFTSCALAALLAPAAASAQTMMFGSGAAPFDFAMNRTGIDTELRFGLDVCVPTGDNECKSIHTGGGLGFYAGYRFLPFVAAGLSLQYYEIGDGESDISTSTKQMPFLEVRGYLPFSFLDFYVRLGLGYQTRDITVDKTDSDSTAYGIGSKVGLGATFFIMSFDKWGELGAGLDLDYAIETPQKAEACQDGKCKTDDVPGDFQSDDWIMLNMHVSYVLPII